jgi:tetratricopeptide (TPR) repeat protein
MSQKTCFVVQGFGEKTDLTNGRKLNLDASYAVIKEAVEETGLKCVRADEVVHSGTIDKPMYEWILTADLVIADLSTYNVNAAYELGVRYGVAPRATITVAEDQFKNPFDVSHIVLYRYKHLGEDIGVAEARRFKKDLSQAIRAVMAEQKVDSPVYDFLEIDPPVRRQQLAADVASEARSSGGSEARSVDPPAAAPADGNAKALLDRARAAMAEGRFVAAREVLEIVHELRPRDEYVIQQLVLATYKSKDPDPLTALQAAHQILLTYLNPENTNDPETLGLSGAVQKRMWDLTHERPHLDTAIAAYERGFYLKQDFYNGINLAFLFNVRAAEHRAAGATAEAIADFVLARRIRREVSRYCEQALGAGTRSPDETYWILATLWEAAVGVDDVPGAARWQQEAEQKAAAVWMVDSTRSQIAVLTMLLAASPLKELTLPQ